MHRALSRLLQREALNPSRGPRQHLRRGMASSQSLTADFTDNKQAQWHKAFTNAEKIVGEPDTSFLWQVWTSDKGIGAASHVNKLLRISHPVMKTVKSLIYDGRCQLQTRGIIVMLLSRCAGHIPNGMFPGEWDEVAVDGLTKRQRKMAEIVEMIHVSHTIHRDVVNVSRELVSDPGLLQDLEFGNKIAILIGDIFIANASKKSAEMRNSKVLGLIATSISDFMKSEFIIRHDPFGRPLPPESPSLDSWEKRTFLNTGSLLAHTCQSSVIMAGHGQATERRTREFCRSLGYAWQLHEELEPFLTITSQPAGTPFDLTTLPVTLYLEKNPQVLASLAIATSSPTAAGSPFTSNGSEGSSIDYADIYAKVLGSGAVEEAQERLRLYVDQCLRLLEAFDSCSKSQQVLRDIILALK